MKAAKPGLREFEKVAAMAWEVPLEELLTRVNRVASKLFLVREATDSRINPNFVPRNFRHYVTLGCIDPGRREGRRALYGYRHFLQALLVRRLLWERVPAHRMPEIMAGQGIEEMKGMLFEGVEMVAKDGAGEGNQECGPDAVAIWKCVRVSPGVELHLSCDLPKPKPAALKKLLADLEAALRRNL